MFNRWKFQKLLARSISSRRSKGKIEIPKPTSSLKDWVEKRATSKSLLQHLQPKVAFFGPDYLRVMQTPIDLSPSAIKRWYERRMIQDEEVRQTFNQERYEILGPDLAAAHFVVFRGGAVRFYNEKEWVRRKEDGNYVLPKKFLPGLYVEAIDCKGFDLRKPGLENILDLTKLNWLSLHGNQYMDDWCLDSISGSYGDSLQYLDISHCPRISHRGLACFYRFENLDTLVVEGTSDNDEFRLSCMMLEDIKPRLTIKGITHDGVTQKMT